jgi:hypothetical protein
LTEGVAKVLNNTIVVSKRFEALFLHEVVVGGPNLEKPQLSRPVSIPVLGVLRRLVMQSKFTGQRDDVKTVAC